jgi:alkanesulfonate monooxygenase SsuD/methylene tetrahydromethanopterin reductase-like flavin-dependent oxidoreductase (luciferase family)/putative sterol carrier protein
VNSVARTCYTSTVKFGLFYEHQIPRPWQEGAEQKLLLDALEQIELADRLGMHYVWEVEHHFLEEYSHSSAPEVFLAAASQRTKRIRLGHGIVQLPPGFNHPARVAERIATLDLVSGGRVEFGTGESASQAELGGFGIDRSLKHAQWDEALDAITRMFVEEPFAGYQGRFIWMPPRNVVPKPSQKPHPPLWVACSRRESILIAARKGIGALSFSFIEPEEAKTWVDDYYRIVASDECTAAGFAVNPNLAVVVPFMCHPDEQTAIERGIDGAHFFGYSLAHYYVFGKHEPGRTNVWEEFNQNRDNYGFARNIVQAGDAPLGVRLLQEGIGSLRGAVGTPQQITDLLARYEKAGVDAVIFVAQAGRNRHEHICESVELFAREVMPRFSDNEEARERAKRERLAEACEKALQRRSPARQMTTGYLITSTGEPSTPPAATVNGNGHGPAQNMQSKLFARIVRSRDDRQLDRLMSFRPAQRLIFKGMEKAFHPERAKDFAAEVQYELKGSREVVRWTVRVADCQAKAEPRQAVNPMLTFRMTLPTFARIAAGEINAVTAMLEQRLEVDGDIKKLAQFTGLFLDR